MDYLVSAAIRMFIFEDRIEIYSPGHLPNNLTVEHIRSGISNIRNPILASFVAKGILPYRGLGSGIKRALEAWPDIEFIDDRDACLFTVVVKKKFGENPHFNGKKPETTVETTVETRTTTPAQILRYLRENPEITLSEISERTGKSVRAVERAAAKLTDKGKIRHTGPKKGGRWEVMD